MIIKGFICLREKDQTTRQTEQHLVTANTSETKSVKDTRRSLLKFTFKHKMKSNDILLNKKLTFESWQELSIGKIRQSVEGKYTGTRPQVTDKLTKPITAHSDTTSLLTESRTSPITRESVTTPILSEPGQQEVKTDKEKIWVH